MKNVKNRIIIVTLIVLVSVSCNKNWQHDTQETVTTGISEDTILVGVSAALSGDNAYLGKQLTQGSLAYIKKINEEDGIFGRDIKLILLDDAYDPAKTLENTKKLINKEKVFVLFDYVGTPTAKVVIKLISKNKIPMIGAFTGAEFLRNPLQPYIFNVRASYFNEIEYMIDKWYKEGKKRIAVFIQDDVFGETILTGAELALARHKMDVLVTSSYTRGGIPSKQSVEKIIEARPDAIIIGGTSRPLALFVKMVREKGLSKTPMHTVSFVGDIAFAEELGKMGRGVNQNVFMTQVVPSPDDDKLQVVREFKLYYKKYFPKERPNYVALEGFINAKILVEALKRCGKKPDRGRLIKSFLEMGDYNSGIGTLPNINIHDHSFYHKVFLSAIKDGTFRVME